MKMPLVLIVQNVDEGFSVDLKHWFERSWGDLVQSQAAAGKGSRVRRQQREVEFGSSGYTARSHAPCLCAQLQKVLYLN